MMAIFFDGISLSLTVLIRYIVLLQSDDALRQIVVNICQAKLIFSAGSLFKARSLMKQERGFSVGFSRVSIAASPANEAGTTRYETEISCRVVSLCLKSILMQVPLLFSMLRLPPMSSVSPCKSSIPMEFPRCF